jgi:hypothetical protein
VDLAHGVEQHRSAAIPLYSQTEDVAFQQPITYAKSRSFREDDRQSVAFDDAG